MAALALENPTSPLHITMVVRGWLIGLLKKQPHNNGRFVHILQRRTSLKDLVESCGIPHTEIGSLHTDNTAASFSDIPGQDCTLEIRPHSPPVDVLISGPLRPQPLPAVRFLVDINVAKLAGRLRMAGFDTLFDPAWSDSDLADIAHAKRCILLSRDQGLLKRKKVEFGHLIRETEPTAQLGETLHFFGLLDQVRPFSRCMRCNGLLVSVEKEEIVSALEPLTKKYYHAFRQCADCRRIYWPGSHREKMEEYFRFLASYQPLPY